MSSNPRILLLLMWPVAFLAGLYALGMTIPVPQLGRGYVLRLELPDSGTGVGLPRIEGPLDGSRPLVVIDAGHGGHDPGASGSDRTEKDLVLGLARALRSELLRQGGVRVALTRDSDRFLALDERTGIARKLGADLFISIHADSAGEERTVTGASIYTLSQTASDRMAAQLAVKENRADRVNGVDLASQSDVVSAILVDLSQRRVKEESLAFARLILREGDGTLAFLEAPLRSAAFVVLKSPDTPSVLFEAGYISNPAQAARLSSAEGRKAFGETLARAIRIHFARRESS